MKNVSTIWALPLFLMAACDGPSSTALPEGVTVEPSTISDTHTVGTSPCPQDLGEIVITNSGSSAVQVQRIGMDSMFEVIDAGGASVGETEVLTVDAGATLRLTVRFNCSIEPPTSTAIDFDVTRGSESGVAVVNVSLQRG